MSKIILDFFLKLAHAYFGRRIFLSLLAGKLNHFKQMLTKATKGTYRQYKDVLSLWRENYTILNSDYKHKFSWQKTALLERK